MPLVGSRLIILGANLDKVAMKGSHKGWSERAQGWSFKLQHKIKGDFRWGSKVHGRMIEAILLVERFKLVPRPLDECPRPKKNKLRLNLHGTCFVGKINGFGPKNSAKRRAPDLENQESG